MLKKISWFEIEINPIIIKNKIPLTEKSKDNNKNKIVFFKFNFFSKVKVIKNKKAKQIVVIYLDVHHRDETETPTYDRNYILYISLH